jgi:CDP-diacylglycerol--glycerol-3-phosphate 3-phosphatidyltransferase
MATTTPKEPPVFNLPNQLTAARLGLAVVLFVLIAWHQWVGCVIVFALAALTDWLDGYFARKMGIVSAVGRNFDPLVDKVLICGAYIFLLPVENAGLVPWMVTLVVARELIITSLRSFLENRGANFGADWLGKIKMVLQCAALIAIFVALEVPSCCPDMSTYVNPLQIGLIYAMIAATALSGLQYLWRAVLLFKADA